MNEIISCPYCGLRIKISGESKVGLCNYPIMTIIEFLNRKIPEEENEIALKRVIENTYSYKAEVTTKLTNKELSHLINVVVMGYCSVCGRNNVTFSILRPTGLPNLYEGQMIAGGIGPVTLSYTNGVITAHDPVPDVTVELNVVK